MEGGFAFEHEIFDVGQDSPAQNCCASFLSFRKDLRAISLATQKRCRVTGDVGNGPWIDTRNQITGFRAMIAENFSVAIGK
jgi:hypothetical protein